MTDPVFNVLFLCTGNSARSIMAESILRKLGAERFNAFSAGSHPKGTVNPLALKTIVAYGLPIEGLRSKNWDEFATPEAPKLDFAFTLCDDAAGETCPAWPGQPMTAHWGIEDRQRSKARISRRNGHSPRRSDICATESQFSLLCQSEVSTSSHWRTASRKSAAWKARPMAKR